MRSLDLFLRVLVPFAVFALAGSARATITEIIDSSGAGGGLSLDGPESVAVDASGNVYVVGSSSNNVFRISPAGSVTEILDAMGDGSASLLGAHYVAVDAAGNVYVSGVTSDNVFRISTPGTCSTTGTPCTVTEVANSTGDGLGHELEVPVGLATDAAGSVYVAAQLPNSVFKIATPGSCSTSGTPCTITEIVDYTGDGAGRNLYRPFYVALDSAGNVYVTGLLHSNVFRVATPGTCSTTGTPCTITEIIDDTGDGSGNTVFVPKEITTDDSGNVYLIGDGSTNAFKVATPGTCSTTGTPCTITEIIDNTGDGAGNSLSGPWGIAADAAGNVYVPGGGTHNVFRIDPSGGCSTGGTPCVITEIIDSSGDGANMLVNPYHVAADALGILYVSGTSSDNAFRIAPPAVPTLPGSPAVRLLLLMGGAATVFWLRARRAPLAWELCSREASSPGMEDLT